MKLLDTIIVFPIDYAANETQHVFTREDVRERVKVVSAEEKIARGEMDYLRATVERLGSDHYILSGGVIGTVYSCGWHAGQSNALAMLRTDPELMDYLCARILEQNIEQIRALAAQGGDGIYIDDATATSDMISVKHYERFSLPYMRAMVDEIHRLGHQAIVIYFGGVSDRLDQIAATGADGFSMETSMKGYVNDIEAIARAVGERMTLFGNVDPVGCLQDADDAALEMEAQRQAQAGRLARGFVMSTGSPITPDTAIARVRRFIELGRTIQ
jgi:uroporphyrinogen decarboxylase